MAAAGARRSYLLRSTSKPSQNVRLIHLTSAPPGARGGSSSSGPYGSFLPPALQTTTDPLQSPPIIVLAPAPPFSSLRHRFRQVSNASRLRRPPPTSVDHLLPPPTCHLHLLRKPLQEPPPPLPRPHHQHVLPRPPRLDARPRRLSPIRLRYNVVIRNVLCAQQYPLAHGLLAEMPSHHAISPDLVLFSTLIDLAREADRLFWSLRRLGVSASIVTYIWEAAGGWDGGCTVPGDTGGGLHFLG